MILANLEEKENNAGEEICEKESNAFDDDDKMEYSDNDTEEQQYHEDGDSNEEDDIEEQESIGNFLMMNIFDHLLGALNMNQTLNDIELPVLLKYLPRNTSRMNWLAFEGCTFKTQLINTQGLQNVVALELMNMTHENVMYALYNLPSKNHVSHLLLELI
jgi:hypothetical protein